MKHRSAPLPSLAIPLLSFALAANAHAGARPRGKASRPAVVLLPALLEDAPLFAEEAERLSQATAAYLGTLKKPPVALVPVKEIAALAAIAAQRKVRADGPSCAGMPTVNELIDARFPSTTHGRAQLRAVWGCQPDERGPAPDEATCAHVFVLALTVEAPDAGGATSTLYDLRAPVDKAEDPAAWIAALAKLSPRRSSLPLGVAFNPASGPGIKIDVLRAAPSGSWGSLRGFDRHRVRPADPSRPSREGESRAQEGPSLAGLLSLAQPDMWKCHRPGRRIDERAVFALDGAGKLLRCEARADSEVDAATLRCLCDALKPVEFPAARGARRASLALINVPDPVPLPNEPKRPARAGNARFIGVTTDEKVPFAEPLTIGREAAIACATNHQAAGRVRYSFTGLIDASGRVASVATDPALPAAPLGPCLEAALTGMPFSCPPSGRPIQLRGVLEVMGTSR